MNSAGNPGGSRDPGFWDRVESSLAPLLRATPALRDDASVDRFMHLLATASPEKLTAWPQMAVQAGLSSMQVGELRLTLELGRLTNGNAPLVDALRGYLRDGHVRDVADLLDIDERGWQVLSRHSTAPSITTLQDRLRDTYPMRYLRKVVAAEPAIDWGTVGRLVESDPGFDPVARMPARRRQAASDSRRDASQERALAILRREVRAFPDFDWRAAIRSPTRDGQANAIRAGVVRFLVQAVNFDLRTIRVDRFVADHPMSMEGIEGRASVLAQLKRMQRVYRIVPNAGTMQILLEEGLHSAFRITRMPADVFVARLGALVGEGAAASIHATALSVTSATAALAWAARLRATGPLPAAVGHWPPPELNVGGRELERLLQMRGTAAQRPDTQEEGDEHS